MTIRLTDSVKFPTLSKSSHGKIGLTKDRKFPKKTRKQCEHCKDWFDEDELDRRDSRWLCHNCEEFLREGE